MQVQSIKQQNINESKQPQFKGGVDTTMRFLATNQAVGANGVDLTFMVMPRSINDTAKRGPAAGLETFRREIMGTVNDSSVGLFGAGAGALVAYQLNKKYGTNVNKMFTDPNTLHILAENRSEQLKKNSSQIEYFKTTLKNVKAYNPASANADNEGYVKLSDKTIDEVSKILNEELNKKTNFNKWTKDSTLNSRTALLHKIAEDTGAEAGCKLFSADKKTVSETNVKALLNDLFIVTESFNKDKVNNAFASQIKNGKGINENVFIKGVNRFMKTRAAMGFAIASAIGLSVQPINMYLTKLKTGTDGFVGVEGRSKDNSNGFLAAKFASSVAFFSMILGTLNMKPWQFTPKKFMDKMAFTGKMPTINQLKGIYGVTIISRIFSARDKDELREVLTKDTLGYLSWLVLGDFVNRMAANGLDKSVMNYKKGTENSNYWKKMFYANLKTRDEILIKTLADNNVATTKQVDGGIKAKSFKEMLKDLDKLSPEIRKTTRKRLTTLNRAQVAGYLFSGLVLGLGIPNLNIYITNKLDKKHKAEAAAKAKEVSINDNAEPAKEISLKPELKQAV